MSMQFVKSLVCASLLTGNVSYASEVENNLDECKNIVIELMNGNRVVYPVKNNKGKVEQLDIIIKGKKVGLYLPESEVLVASSTIEGKNTKGYCFIKGFEVR